MILNTFNFESMLVSVDVSVTFGTNRRCVYVRIADGKIFLGCQQLFETIEISTRPST